MSEDKRPFPGLAPFKEEDAWLFFGREEEIRVITANLQAARLTLLYGESGAGKSSLLNAGVAAPLREQSVEDAKRWGKPDFQVITFRAWLGDPLDLFAAEVGKLLPDDEKLSGGVPLAEILSHAAKYADRRVLVILDQLEEYFRYLADGKSTPGFLEQFETLWKTDLHVNFLLALREDSLGVLDRFKGRIPNPFDNYLRLDHLTAKGARQAIVEPIAQYNKHSTPQVSFASTLADRVLAKILGHEPKNSGDERIQASILQLVLTRWWDRQIGSSQWTFDESILNSLGGVETIVRDHFLETIKNELTPAQQKQAARIFVPLVTGSGRKIAYTDTDIASTTALSKEVVRSVLGPLEKKRILSTVPLPPKAAAGDICYEFSHDLLATAALEWRKDEERSDAQRQAEQEKKRADQLGLYLRLVAVAFVLALLGLAYGFYQSRKANQQANLATAHRLAAQSNLIGTDDAAGIQESSLIAVESMKRAALFENDRILRNNTNLLRRLLFPRFQHGSRVSTIAFTTDGMTVATGSWDRSVRLSETTSGKQLASLWHDGFVLAAAFNPDGQKLATGSDDNTARIWEVATGKELQRLQHSNGVLAVCFSGKTALTGTREGSVRLWDADSGKMLKWLRHGNSTVDSMVFRTDCNVVATSSADKIVRLWDVASGKLLGEGLQHGDGVEAVAFSRDGAMVATSSDDKIVRVWNVVPPRQDSDPKFGKELQRLEPDSIVKSLAFTRDGRILVTGDDSTAQFWEIASRKVLARLPLAGVSAVALDSNDKILATGSGNDGTVSLWDIAPKELVRLPAGSAATVVALSPDAKTFATASDDNIVRLWDASSGAELQRLWHKGAVDAIGFSPAGKVVATGNEDGTTRLWDAASGKQLAPALVQNGTSVLAVSFSPDGKSITTVGHDYTARLWDAASGKELKRQHLQLDQLPVGIIVLAFSPDGETVAVGNDDGSVWIWKPKSGAPSSPKKWHVKAVTAIRFDERGARLATADKGGTVRLWDTATYQEVVRINLDLPAFGLLFSPDSAFLSTASLSSDRLSVKILRHLLRPEELIREACSKIIRDNLKREEWEKYVPGEPYPESKTCADHP